MHNTFDVMDAPSLTSVLAPSLVVTLAAVIHPDQQQDTTIKDSTIKVIVVEVLQPSLPLHTISVLVEP